MPLYIFTFSKKRKDTHEVLIIPSRQRNTVHFETITLISKTSWITFHFHTRVATQSSTDNSIAVLVQLPLLQDVFSLFVQLLDGI